jgi:hypothetical protein
MFLARAGIPTAIPATMTSLNRYGIGKYPRDPEMRTGPIALTDYRNEVVHPDRPRRSEDLGWKIGYEARQLALWYLELALLWICDYQGDYVSRPLKPRVIGEVNRVPWVEDGSGWPSD